MIKRFSRCIINGSKHRPGTIFEKSTSTQTQTRLAIKHEAGDDLSASEMECRIIYFNDLTSEKNEWNIKNEARNANGTATTKSSLKNCFRYLVPGDLQFADFLNCRFSKIGKDLGDKKAIFHGYIVQKKYNESTFQPISLFE